MAITLRIKRAEDLQKVAALLRGAKRKFHKELAVAFHDAGEETLYTIRGNVLSMNITGRRKPRAKRRFVEPRPGTALRSRIADAVKLEVKPSGDNPHVSFTVDSASMGGARGGGNIPYQLEMRGRWRHPIMGNKHAWVANVGEKGWFYDEANAARKEFVKAIDEAIDRFVDEIQEEL
jgi:hypothetical protein